MILSKRLNAAAAYVRKGAVLADVGTDHAYLPIFAVENGIASRAVASDINEGPLKNAESNIERHGLSEKIECVLTSGFEGLDGFGITDAVIAGMGGELIATIIENASFIRRDCFRLIIQPMTMHEAARKALFSLGFSVIGEYVLKEDGKFYTVICADYTGDVAFDVDDFLLLYGDESLRNYESDNVRKEYLTREISKYERISKGKCSAGINTDAEDETARKLKERL